LGHCGGNTKGRAQVHQMLAFPDCNRGWNLEDRPRRRLCSARAVGAWAATAQYGFERIELQAIRLRQGLRVASDASCNRRHCQRLVRMTDPCRQRMKEEIRSSFRKGAYFDRTPWRQTGSKRFARFARALVGVGDDPHMLCISTAARCEQPLGGELLPVVSANERHQPRAM